MNPRKYYSSSTNKEKAMVVDMVREADKDMRSVKYSSLSTQVAHTRWEVSNKKIEPQGNNYHIRKQPQVLSL